MPVIKTPLKKIRTGKGFSLLELTIVLAIIGVVVGGGLVVLTAATQTQQVNTTVAKMAVIEKALLNYGMNFNRLPCPSDLRLKATDTNYGVEAANKASCIGGTPEATNVAASGTVEGGVPTRELKLPDEYMYDGWGRRLRYAVNPEVTAANAFPASSCSSTKSITVNDASGTARTTSGIYALISHGKNGHGAYTTNGAMSSSGSTSTDELTNCHCSSADPTVAGTYDPIYVEKLAALDPADPLKGFDDIVTFKEDWQIQALNYPRPEASCGNYLVLTPATRACPAAYYVASGVVTALPAPAQCSANQWSGSGGDISPDNRTFAWGGSMWSHGNATAGVLYDVTAAGLVHSAVNIPEVISIADVAFSPDGEYLVVGGYTLIDPLTLGPPFIRMYSKGSGDYSTIASSTATHTDYTGGGANFRFAWNSDGSVLFVSTYSDSSADQTSVDVYTRSAGTLTYLKTISGNDNGWVSDIAIHPSGNFLAIGGLCCGSTGPYVVVDPLGAATQISGGGSGLGSGYSPTAGWSPDGNFLSATHNTNTLAIYRFNSAGPGGVYFTPVTITGNSCVSTNDRYQGAKFSKDSKYFAIGGDIGGQTYLCVLHSNADGSEWTQVYYALTDAWQGAKLTWSK